MGDDLVKLLRWLADHASFEPRMHHAAADRIEKLEASEVEWQTICDSYAAENQRFSDRIETLEAALRKYADEEYNGFNACGGHAREALEGKDD